MWLNKVSHLPKPLNHKMEMVQRLTASNVSFSSLKMIQNNLNIHIYKWNKQLILPVSWLGVRCLYSTLNSDLHLSPVAKSLDLYPPLGSEGSHWHQCSVLTPRHWSSSTSHPSLAGSNCQYLGNVCIALHTRCKWPFISRLFSKEKKNSQWEVSSFMTAAAGRS